VAPHEGAAVAGMLGDLDQDVADDPRDRAGIAVDDLDELPRRCVQQARQRRLGTQRRDGAFLRLLHVADYPARDGGPGVARTDCMKPALLAVLIAAVLTPASQARVASSRPTYALVTAETLNQLVVVALPSGRVVKRIRVPADPQNVEAYAGAAAVVSTRAGSVTLLAPRSGSDPRSIRVWKVIRGFGGPHIAAFAPDGDYLYATDDERGQVAVILGRVIRKVFVGRGAHHMAFAPDERRLWIALGERARSIVVLDTSRETGRIARPRKIGHVDPKGLAHDLAFTPDGRYVWVTYDDRPFVRVFDARTKRPVATLYCGAAPCHVRFDDTDGLPAFSRYVYLSSGNSGRLRIFDWRTRRLVRTMRTPTGSFNLSIDRGAIATASLTQGIVTEFAGDRRTSIHVASATRDVALATP
jgi:DNA-binding beta-propeller fold protein YncE